MPTLMIIAGPCVIESLELCLTIGSRVKSVCEKLGLEYVFKASFDKANRSSNASFRGPGVQEGLKILERVKRELGVEVLTDVHESEQAAIVAQVVDILQIPAFLARQTDLLIAAARTGKKINIKKGQFMAPQEMGNAIEKVRAAREGSRKGSGFGVQGSGNSRENSGFEVQGSGTPQEASRLVDPHHSSLNPEPRTLNPHSNPESPTLNPHPNLDTRTPKPDLFLTERGTFFGYNRLVNDFTGLAVMKSFNVPVIFDITHSTQQPAGLGNQSGGNPQYSPLLAKAAIATGCVDGLFLECHPDPKNAKSDAATMMHLEAVEPLLTQCQRIANASAIE